MSVNFVNIPTELKNNASFCLWRKERGRGTTTRITKVPYNPRTGEMAKTNDPSTFSDFPTTIKAYAMGGYDGIGFRVSEGIGAIDIDHCIREDGTLNDVAASILGIFSTAYFEKSPSGTGLRGFFKLDEGFVYDKTIYYINNRKLGLEIYLPGTTNRFVTVTGNQYRPGIVPMDMTALASILDTFMKRKSQVTNTHIEPCSYLTDEEVINHALAAKDGDVFRDYLDGRWHEHFDNQSDADMSFVSKLCFWCGCVEEQIDRIFRTSGMMRPKWEEYRGESTYGSITIRNAVASCKDIYLPPEMKDANLAAEFEDLDKLDELESSAPDEYKPDYSKVTATIESLAPHSNPRYGQGEIGIGYLFADYFKDIARYNEGRGVWFYYDGKTWRPDAEKIRVAEMAKHLANRLLAFATTIPEENTRMRFIERVKKLQQKRHRDTMINDAKSVHPIANERFDSDNYLFNCQNGTLDLRTNEFRPHDSNDYLTMIAGIDYDPSATCPRWESFINEVMCGDAELADFLQQSLGYALTGDTAQECLFILYGATSRNGKGTTMETYLKIMKDYGKTSNPEMLAARFGSSSSSGPSEEVARLNGSRFVNISEPEKKMSFNAALVKRMTGNNMLNARLLHENSFDFKPKFKIFIDTNYRPNITDMTLFESGRIKIIPFKRHFNEEEQDKTLKSFFSKPENLSAIFNWCLEGYHKFQKKQLKKPQAVIDETEDYRKESDRIAQFIDAWLEEGEAYEVRTSAAYKVYSKWCDDNGYRPDNKKGFNTAMQVHFVRKEKRPAEGGEKTTMFLGCRIRVDGDEDGGADGDCGEVFKKGPEEFDIVR